MLDFLHPRNVNLKTDTLSGVTVALALVPEAVAFAFTAGVSPVVGLYSAFFLCMVAAVAGGRPGMISGATGSMAVVIVTLVARHGLEYLFPAVILCGLIQVTIGVLGLGKLIRMVPRSVELGFVNGLAIVIFMAQLGSFKTISNLGRLEFLSGPSLWIMLGLVALTMAIIWLLPKLSRAIPASLAAILIVTGVALLINATSSSDFAGINQRHVVMTVGDMLLTKAKAKAVANAESGTSPMSIGARTGGTPPAGLAMRTASKAMQSVNTRSVSLAGGLPLPFFIKHALPPISLGTLLIILPYALMLAGVGLIESLMTLRLIDDITESRGSGNRECIGQGVANVICGFFGGMGGCAMIGQSLINVNSGGRGRWSGITAAVCLLAFVLFLSRWIEMIPMAALVGVMFMVVIGTFEWGSLHMAWKVPASDYLVLALVAGYTVVMHDLAMAVILGVIVSALSFAWRHAAHVGADIKFNEFGSKIYQLHGPLFFASVTGFRELFDPKTDPDDVVIDFYYTRVYDQSGLAAINDLAERYMHLGKRLHLTHLSPECRKSLARARDLVVVNISEDPQYHVATERLG